MGFVSGEAKCMWVQVGLKWEYSYLYKEAEGP